MAASKKSRARVKQSVRPAKPVNPTQERVLRTAKALKLSASKLKVGVVKELTKAQRAALLGIGVRRVQSGYHLSPAVPSDGSASLEFYSPMMVLASQVNWPGKPKTGMALFSSKYWHVSNPTVQVEFDLVEPGKKHLVELYMTTNQSGPYKFRVIPGPTGQAKDLALSASTKVITEVIDPAPGFNGPYYVSFMQLNTKADAKSWYFHKMVVTAAS